MAGTRRVFVSRNGKSAHRKRKGKSGMRFSFGRNRINEAAEKCRRIWDAVPADVREADEHASGYLPGAVNMAPLRIRAACILSDRPLYVHCQRGTRAVRILEKAGFRQAGGIGGITIPEKTGEVSGTYGEDKAAKTGTCREPPRVFAWNADGFRQEGLLRATRAAVFFTRRQFRGLRMSGRVC